MAAENNADRTYLQVEHGNEAASWLYVRAGFAEMCAHHYRSAWSR